MKTILICVDKIIIFWKKNYQSSNELILILENQNYNLFIMSVSQSDQQPLYRNNLRNSRIEKISKSYRMGRLFINNIRLNIKDIKYICNQQWEQLNSLNMNECHINDRKFELLAKKVFKNLTAFYIQHNNITHLGFYFLKDTCWKNLISLEINYNKIGVKGCKYLTIPEWINLQRLDLSFCQICNEGAHHLSKGHWPMLSCLMMNNNNISMIGIDRIQKANWRNLRTFIISDSAYLKITCFNSIFKMDWPNITSISIHQLKILNFDNYQLNEDENGNLLFPRLLQSKFWKLKKAQRDRTMA